jgi:hypothetical protein
VEDALAAQLCIMEALFALIPPRWGIHRRLLIPYVEQFWSHRLARQRFSFRGPAVVEAALVEAKAAQWTNESGPSFGPSGLESW